MRTGSSGASSAGIPPSRGSGEWSTRPTGGTGGSAGSTCLRWTIGYGDLFNMLSGLLSLSRSRDRKSLGMNTLFRLCVTRA